MATASMVRDGERMNGSVALLSGTLCDTIMCYAFTFLSLRPLSKQPDLRNVIFLQDVHPDLF
jgi:hypothetical protein